MPGKIYLENLAHSIHKSQPSDLVIHRFPAYRHFIHTLLEVLPCKMGIKCLRVQPLEFRRYKSAT
jgi:hypothetical protein